MTSRNQHPRQAVAKTETSEDERVIGILFQMYSQFGHDMSPEERAAIRNTIYARIEVLVGAGIGELSSPDVPAVVIGE